MTPPSEAARPPAAPPGTTGRGGHGPWSVDVADPDPAWLPDTARWHVSGLALLPQRLLASARDRRWETRWVLARRGGFVEGVLPVCRPRGDAAPEPLYDLGLASAAIGLPAPASPRRWLYVGGFRDLVSGTTTAADLAPGEREQLRQALVAGAFTEAWRHGLHPLAMFVRAEEVAAFRQGLGERARAGQARQAAAVDLPASVADYVTALPKRVRYRVRTELRQLDELGVRAVESPFAQVLDEALPLIVETKLRHGVAEHVRLAGMRMREWAAGGAAEILAFTLRDDSGALLGASFAARHGDIAELYELGLRADAGHRHLLYTELLVYAPLRYAIGRGCRRLGLGLDSLEPKLNRGARAETVWAVGGDPPPGQPAAGTAAA